MNKKMLKVSTLVAVLAFVTYSASAQQGFGTNQPSKASAIEMTSANKGLLIPRVALTGLNNFEPIKGELGTDAAKVNSLLIYNTATTTGITPGYYYWTTDGTTPNSYWKRLLASDDAAALSLLGDVTGTLGATTVVKIQGHDVANTAPTSNQVLTWNGTAWTPTSLTPAQITNKANLSVQDGIAITAGSGTDVLLGAATIGISNGGIAPIKIQPAEEPTTRMVMVTQTDGTVTWIPQTDIAPTTTNDLTSAINSMTSNVNGVSSSANIINSNTLVLTGDNLESTVNGVATTPAVDLSKYLDNTDEQEITDFSVTGGNLSITIENGNTMTVPLSSIDTDNQTITDLSLNGTQLSITLERGGAPVTVDLTALTNTTNLGNGTNTTVLGDGSSTTPYTVNVATGNGTTLGVVRQADTTPSVTVTNGVLAVDPANVAITNALTSSGNQMSSTVNSGTAQTASIINTNALSLNTDNHLVSTINGFPSSALDLSAAVQAAQKTTTVTAGTNTTVTPTAPNATGNTEYEVNVATGNGTTLGVVKEAATNPSVAVAADGSLSVNIANITDRGSLSASTGDNSITVNNGTNATFVNTDIKVTDGGISTAKIADDAVTAAKVNADVAGNGLTQAANGALQVNVNNGISIADDLVQLGGALIKPTTITADATNTLAVAGLQPTTDAAKTTDAFVVVGDNGVLKKADIKYSTTEQVTGKKWIGGQVVYERVLEVTLNVEANTITLPTGSRPAKIIGMRMISRTDNSITTELSRYNATEGVMVFGSGPTTQFQKVGTYDLILEYIK